MSQVLGSRIAGIGDGGEYEEEEYVGSGEGVPRGALEEAGANDIDAMEIAGGGIRVPFVQEAVRDAAGKDGAFPLSRILDDAALVFGATLVASVPSDADEDAEGATMDVDRWDCWERLREDEAVLSRRDDELRRRDELRNRIEARVLELRSARHGARGSLLPSTDKFASFLDGTNDWLFSEECDGASLSRMREEWASVQARTNAMCGSFLAAEREEQERKDREMEEEAQRAAAAAAAANGDGDNEDHDDHGTRKLPAKRRMEIVTKNKKEANELFADGNHRHAAARYTKVLSHYGKFFDLAPDEEKEVQEVKLSLHLNLALAYTKMGKLEHAQRWSDEALRIDPQSVKALYRRANVLYQKHKFDDESRDLKEAGALAPEDKAVKKLQRLVDQQVAKQKKKEKAMAKKMFG